MSPPRSRLVAAVGVAGALMLVGGIAVLNRGSRTGDFGTATERPPVASSSAAGLSTIEPSSVGHFTASVSTAEVSTAESSTAESSTAESSTDGSSPAEPTTDEPSVAVSPIASFEPAAPIQLDLPQLQVSAEVQPVFTEEGVLQVPENPLAVGWWIASAPAGASSGTTVIDGHVDSAKLGLGAFYRLRELVEGDEVRLTLATGESISYQVVARQTYPKQDGLPAELFDSAGSPRLVLITCGGSFDSSRRSYDDNVVVIAEPTVS